MYITNYPQTNQIKYKPADNPFRKHPAKVRSGSNFIPQYGLFGDVNFKGKTLNQLYDEYNWFIRNDGEKPINAFLKIEDAPKTMDGFFGAILSTNDRSYELIDSIARSGKGLSDITHKLKEKIGPDSENLLTFMPDCPYTKAYKNYITKRYDSAHTMSELLQIRPDWREDALLSKFEHLRPSSNFRIGKVPREFPQESGTYAAIINHLRPNMQIGYKNEQTIPDLRVGNRTYNFKSFTNGRSDKNVFCVTVPEGKKFVIKMGEEKKRGLNKPFGLGTLALIDTYLTTNRSINSAPLHFYDHKHNVSIYSFVEHCPVKSLYEPSMADVNDKLSDFKRLGLYYNDTVGSNNYFQLNDVHKKLANETEIEHGIKNQEWISVDNDHVTFDSILHPRIDGLHAPLPNIMNMCC